MGKAAKKSGKRSIGKPSTPKRPAISHGGKSIEIPLLTGPVGPPAANAGGIYKIYNAASDVQTVEYYLSQLGEIKFLTVDCAPLKMPSKEVVQASEAVQCWDTNRDAAIKAFQVKVGVRDSTETSGGIVKPDGETLKALVDYGDIAEKLDALRDAPKGAKDYTHVGGFEYQKFKAAFEARKAKHLYFKVRYTPSAVDNAWKLVILMQADPLILDIRWMAYMMATAFWEAGHTVPQVIQVPKLGKDKKPVLDASKNPVMENKTIKVWEVMVPIDEINPEDIRRYKAPVKVRKISKDDVELLKKEDKTFEKADVIDGAWIVEKDGDQFVIDKNGSSKWKSNKASRGAAFAGDPAAAYTKAAGDEFAYFGRGYVQLTWWDNYIKSGLALGRGLDLLFNPELVKEPQIAYSLMAYGMRTGEGYANGRKFSDYFYGSTKNYSQARRMVNAGDKTSYAPIAEIAGLFEEMLFEAKL
jgi:hypothetical protein